MNCLKYLPHRLGMLTLMTFPICCDSVVESAEVYIGAATANISPDRPVALWGQMHTRIARNTESPVTASVLILESRVGDKSLDLATLVACDLVAIPKPALEKVRAQVKLSLPEFPLEKIVLSATHTHTAPVLTAGVYEIPTEGVMQP